MDVVGGKFNNAKKDNDFVYHDKVPTFDSLPEVKGKQPPFFLKVNCVNTLFVQRYLPKIKTVGGCLLIVLLFQVLL